MHKDAAMAQLIKKFFSKVTEILQNKCKLYKRQRFETCTSGTEDQPDLLARFNSVKTLFIQEI
jgi:hypothetical protein